MVRGGGRCIKLTLKGLLDYPAEIYPRFCGLGKLVPILECMDVHSRGEEEADCVHDQLLVSVGVISQKRYLGAFLDAAEKNFGGISGQRWASEDVIVCFQGRWGWLPVGRTELIQNINHSHPCVPSLNSWVL